MTADDAQSGPTPDPSGLTSVYLRRARHGDDESLELLIRRVSPFLLAVAGHRLRRVPAGFVEPADLVHEAWARTLPRLDTLSPRDGRVLPVLLTYLTTTIRRTVRDLLVRQLRQGAPHAALGRGGEEDVLAELPAATRGVVTRVVTTELDREVRLAIDALPAPDREVLLLRGIEQGSTKDVAAALAITEDAVKQRYHRARARLQQRLPESLVAELD